MNYTAIEIVNKSPFELPKYETDHASGMDIRANLGEGSVLNIHPGETVLIPTGLYVAIEPGYEIQIRPRSGVSAKTPLRIANSPGTIDADYRGEIKVIMENKGNDWHQVNHGDRIAQMVVAPVIRGMFVEVKDLNASNRGVGGFGSTGFN
jgi:dUTP pyrophosphatase